jgi:cell shape-determining protein MreC
VVIILLFFRPPVFLRTAVFEIGRPVWFVSNKIETTFASTVALFRSKQSLLNENQVLQNTLASMSAENHTVSALQATNAALLGLNESSSTPRLLAGVLVAPPETPYDTLIIDRGSEDGIALHDRVFASENIALGVISGVNRHTSEVLLFSAPNVATPVTLLVATSSIALSAIGQGGSNFILTVPRGTEIATGTPIILRGSATVLLGTVGEAFEKPADSFETVLAVSPVALRSLRFVEVDTNTVPVIAP